MMQPGNEQYPPQAIENVATVMPMDENGYVAMSGMETTEGQPLIGNVIRRSCTVVGEKACAATCQIAALRGEAPLEAIGSEAARMVDEGELDTVTAIEEDPTACSDRNLLRFMGAANVDPESALMVAVTKDNVGFLDDPEVRSQITQNPHGWSEMPAHNAFFARYTDTLPSTGMPVQMLGARLADSGFVTITMKDADGVPVSGIVHSTRTNMPGRDHRKEYDGEQQSFMHHVLSKAMHHYGANPQDVTVRVAAAVGPREWTKRYGSSEILEANLPGWAEEGLIENKTNPQWQPGMEVVNPETGELDELWPQYPTKVINEATEAAADLGITNIYTDEPLNPGVPRNGVIHSTANRPRITDKSGLSLALDTRDVYAVVMRPAE